MKRREGRVERREGREGGEEGREGREDSQIVHLVVATPVQCALLALHEEWRGEGAWHSLPGRTCSDEGQFWGHYAEVGHSQPVILQEGVYMSAWKECHYHAYRHTLGT